MENANQVSGAPTTEGGAKVEDVQAGGEANTEKMVKATDLRRALDDMHKFKQEAAAAKAAKADLEAALLATKEDYKSLSEVYKKENESLKSTLQKRDEAFIYNQKYNAVLVEAQKAGIRDVEDLKLIDMSKISTELTSEGRVLVHGHEEVVNEFKAKKPYCFNSAQAPRVNGGGSVTPPSNQPLTGADLFNMEKQVKLGKLDPSVYKQKVMEFQKQKQARR